MAIIDTVPAVTDVSWREVWCRAEKTLAEAGPVPGWQAGKHSESTTQPATTGKNAVHLGVCRTLVGRPANPSKRSTTRRFLIHGTTMGRRSVRSLSSHSQILASTSEARHAPSLCATTAGERARDSNLHAPPTGGEPTRWPAAGESDTVSCRPFRGGVVACVGPALTS